MVIDNRLLNKRIEQLERQLSGADGVNDQQYDAILFYQEQLKAIKTISDQMYITECSSTKMNDLALELRRVLASSEFKERGE